MKKFTKSFLVCSIILVAFASCAKNNNESKASDVTGFWVGIGTFLRNCQNPPDPCRWNASYSLDLVQNGVDVTGQMDFTLVVDEKLNPGANCDSFLSNGSISNGIVNDNNFSFVDTGGNQWEMKFTEDRMKGIAGNSVENCSQVKSDDLSAVKEKKGEVGGPQTPMTWRNVDECDDNMNVNYKFFDCTNNECFSQVWPEAPDFYQTSGLDATNIKVIECPRAAKVCVGALSEDGTKKWGVGFDAKDDCLECCYFCEESETAFFPFQCENAK